MKKYELYLIDTETDGLDPIGNNIIELSICRISTGEQKTWCMYPLNKDNISADALRVNKHNIDDLLLKTAAGKEKYLDPKKVIIEIENWIAEDFMAQNDRIITGQNSPFDKAFMEQLWKKCNSEDTYPLNRKYGLDTMQIEFFLDYCQGEFAEGYSLWNLCKKYGVKNENSHTAASDVKTTLAIFNKQVEFFKKHLNK